MSNRFTAWIATAPTTNIRLLATVVLSFGTAIRYWAASGATGTWEPNWEWLVFLATMAGIDTLQHHNKRKTAWRPDVVQKEEVVSDETEIG